MDDQLHAFPNQQDLLDIQKKIPELDVASMEIIFLLLRTAGELNLSFHTYLSRFGLSQGKMKILLLLYRDPGKILLPSELAVCSGVTRGTITGLLDGLEKEGYVERIHHKDDRRMVMIRLTPMGEDRIKEVMPKPFVAVKNLLNQISTNEQETLVSILNKLLPLINTMHD